MKSLLVFFAVVCLAVYTSHGFPVKEKSKHKVDEVDGDYSPHHNIRSVYIQVEKPRIIEIGRNYEPGMFRGLARSHDDDSWDVEPEEETDEDDDSATDNFYDETARARYYDDEEHESKSHEQHDDEDEEDIDAWNFNDEAHAADDTSSSDDISSIDHHDIDTIKSVIPRLFNDTMVVVVDNSSATTSHEQYVPTLNDMASIAYWHWNETSQLWFYNNTYRDDEIYMYDDEIMDDDDDEHPDKLYKHDDDGDYYFNLNEIVDEHLRDTFLRVLKKKKPTKSIIVASSTKGDQKETVEGSFIVIDQNDIRKAQEEAEALAAKEEEAEALAAKEDESEKHDVYLLDKNGFFVKIKGIIATKQAAALAAAKAAATTTTVATPVNTTTVIPTTVAPTTVAPTIVAPTIVAPTTVAPTTELPKTIVLKAPSTILDKLIETNSVEPHIVMPVAPASMVAPVLPSITTTIVAAPAIVPPKKDVVIKP